MSKVISIENSEEVESVDKVAIVCWSVVCILAMLQLTIAGGIMFTCLMYTIFRIVNFTAKTIASVF